MGTGVEVDGATFTITDPKLIDELISNRVKQLTNKNGKGGNHCSQWTPEEKLLRHTVIIDYLRQGLSKKRISEELMLRWGICSATARNYIKDALAFLADYNKDDNAIEYVKRKSLERTEGILEMAIESRQWDAALKAVDLLNKLNGLYTEKSQVELSGDIKFDFGE